MYTSQKSIENKVGQVGGWRELLMSVGFRFEPAANGIPAAVFFPQSDPGERLTQCSASLQAVLGLSATSWSSLASLLSSPDSADEIMAMFRQVVGQFGPRELEVESVRLPVAVRMWRIPGCHELLASLGFDLMEVGRDEVTLKTGKLANKRQIQFALQALVALFDTDEAPRSLALEAAESLESLGDEEPDQAPDCGVSPPPPAPPFLGPRKSDIILDGTGGAFSSYARNRGEPDGRQHPDSPPGGGSPGPPGPALPPLYQMPPHTAGRESDCNFTPSPVENLRAGWSRPGPGRHQASRFRHGPSPLSRPESCSSASSAADWEASGQGTVVRRSSKLSPGVTDPATPLHRFRKYLLATGAGSLYETADSSQTHIPVRSVFTEAGYHTNKAKLIETSNTNDKLSIRAEISKMNPSRKKEAGLAARLEPGVTTRVPPTGGSYSPSAGPASQQELPGLVAAGSEEVLVRTEGSLAGENPIQEQILSTQMRRINRELPISEVYHERSLGLGLAPPLSKLIMSNNIAVAQVDHHGPDPGLDTSTAAQASDSMSNFDNLSVIEEAAHPTRRARPVVPPKPAVAEPWLAAGLLRPAPSTGAGPGARDEGDGRSMTDSQYSGCSPSAPGTTKPDITPRFSYMKIKDKSQAGETVVAGAASPLYSCPEDGPVTTVINPAIRPSDIAHYINSEFHSKAGAAAAGPSSHSASHPQVWSKDKNGRFTYNGSFASDC